MHEIKFLGVDAGTSILLEIWRLNSRVPVYTECHLGHNAVLFDTSVRTLRSTVLPIIELD